MSYWCKIGFKQVNPEDVDSVLREFKKYTLSKLEGIAKQEWMWVPSIRNLFKDQLDEAWAMNIFSYRYFYKDDTKVLGIFSIPDCVEDFFDNVHDFQNSTDQDYDFDSWKGLKWFEDTVDVYEDASVEFLKSLDKDIEIQSDSDIDYYRKWFIYKDIWNYLENYLYDDDESLYLTFFKSHEGYGILTIEKFLNMCKEFHKKK